MIDHATRVREHADALKAAIADAVADGYRVDGVGNLNGIGVSETAKVKQPKPEAESAPTVAVVEESPAQSDKPSGFSRFES
jgi:hypothetical protein